MSDEFDVFVSYARRDAAKAEIVRDALVAARLNVFFDAEGIDAGAEFPVVIDRALRGAKCVLGLWSQPALERRWVRIEGRIGLDQKKLVAAIVDDLRPEDLPAEFYNVNFDDLRDFNGDPAHEGWQRVLRAIGRHTGRADLAGAAGRGRAAPQADASAALKNQAPPPVRGGVWRFAMAAAALVIAVIGIRQFAPSPATTPNAAPEVIAPSSPSAALPAPAAQAPSQEPPRASPPREAAAPPVPASSVQQAPADDGKSQQPVPQAADLSGMWVGYFEQAGQRTPINVQFADDGGRLRGKMWEPNKIGDPSAAQLSARLEGRVDPDGEVRFIKQYDGGGGVSHAVEYGGILNSGGYVIEGQWSIGAASGAFRLARR
ncbi:MAG: toll/interleukin-1 receptor domain-containing protein [Caulobacterales bacterium]